MRGGWPLFGAGALALAVVGLAGCSERDDDSSLQMAGWVSSPTEDDLVREVVAGFEAENPDVTVTYNPIQANYIEKIQLMLGTGTAPDVFMLEAFWAPPLTGYDTLLPLDDFIAADPEFDLGDFEPAMLDAFRRDGKLYGIPKDYSTLVLFYNPEMLAEAGFDRPPETWEELAHYAEKLTLDTNGDGRIDQTGFGLVDGLEYVLPFIWQNGSRLIGEDGEPNLDDPALIETLEYLQTMRRKGHARLPSEIGAAWNMDGMGRERVAMSMSGLWAVNFMDETFADVPYKVAPLPLGKEQASIAYVVGYVIPKNANNPEKAWRLLRYLTSKEGQQSWVELGIGLPPRRSTAEIAGTASDPTLSVFTDSARYARTWQLGDDQQLLDEAQTAMQSIFITDTPVEEALAKLKDRLDIPQGGAGE